MVLDSLSARRIPTDDLFVNPAQSNLPIESGASSLYHPPETLGRTYGSDNVAGEGYNTQQQSTGRHGPVILSNLNPTITGSGLEAHSALKASKIPDSPGCPKGSQEMTPGPSCDRSPSMHGNLQHQLGWGLVSPPVTSISVLRPSSSQTHSNVLDSPVSEERSSMSQPRSVKHLTCWYWATQGCKLPEHLCLYSHFDTGRLAEAPVQKQRGRESSFYDVSLRRGPLSNPHVIKPHVTTTLTPY